MIIEHRGVTALIHRDDDSGGYIFLIQGCSTIFFVKLADDDCYRWADALEDELVSKIDDHLDGVKQYPLAFISDEVFLDMIKRIVAERLEVEEKLEKAAKLIEISELGLAKETEDLAELLTALRTQLQLLELERERENKKPSEEFEDAGYDDGPFNGMGDDDDTEVDEEEEEDERTSNRAYRRAQEKRKNKEAKRLLRKIYGLCHPDRTEDPYKHELFNEAKRNSTDVRVLQEILDKVMARGNARLVELQLQEEEQKLKKALEDLERLTGSDDYRVAELWNTHKRSIIGQARAQMMHRIELLKQQISEIKDEKVLKTGFANLKNGFFSTWG